jgi:glycosyltransferase involved in cell wall biosynthesis
MKIVLPVHHFLPKYTAGAELYTFRLARWLQQHGHLVEVVSVESIAAGAPDQLTVTTDTYEGIAVQRLSFNIFGAPQRRIWDHDNALFRAWFASYLRHTQPDLAHFQAGYHIGAGMLFAARDADVPVVLTLHDYWFLCQRLTLLRGDGAVCEHIPESPAGCAWCLSHSESGLVRKLHSAVGQSASHVLAPVLLRERVRTQTHRRQTLAQALQIPKAVLAPSKYLASRYASHVPVARLQICNYGLDLTPFSTPLAPPQKFPAPRPLRIGFIGQMAEHKGVHVLVDAFKRVVGEPANAVWAGAELHLYGNLEAFPAYADRIRSLINGDARIQLHGRFENTRVAEILAGLDVSVVPSTWYENQPLAILESRAAGTPVITSNLGGMIELIDHDVNGLRFAPADASDLARQLLRLLREPELLPRLRAGARRLVPRSIDDEMAQVLRVYQQVTNEQQAADDGRRKV